jgi:hypothetical protein
MAARFLTQPKEVCEALGRSAIRQLQQWRGPGLIGVTLCARPVVTRVSGSQDSAIATPVVADKESVGRKR